MSIQDEPKCPNCGKRNLSLVKKKVFCETRLLNWYGLPEQASKCSKPEQVEMWVFCESCLVRIDCGFNSEGLIRLKDVLED